MSTAIVSKTRKVTRNTAPVPAPKKQKSVIRNGTTGTPGQAVASANRWRENYNPFRQFAIRKAVSLLEAGQKGDYALLQWTYRKLERSYPTLSGLISRCEAPLLNFKWDIKIKSQLPEGYVRADAEAQQQTLHTAYEAVDNLTESIRHLHLAEFREYAHLQKHRSFDGEVMHLECLDQWLLCRDGIYGDWFWNPESKSLDARALGEANRIGSEELPIEDFIIRTVARPINEIALVSFARWSLVMKDADGFIEIYGIPGGVVTMPADVPSGKESEYETAARLVAEGGSGAIPHGSTYTPNDGPRGVDPFTPRLARLDEDLVLAGTGGKMSMLAAQAGLGGGNQGAQHDEVFQEIAHSRAMAISEAFQRGFDAEVIEREHGGEPCLVYFELAPEEDVNVDALVKNLSTLAAGGFKPDLAWLNEQTGYVLTASEDDAGDQINDIEEGDLEDEEELPEVLNRFELTGEQVAILNRHIAPLHDAAAPNIASEFTRFMGNLPKLSHELAGTRADEFAETITGILLNTGSSDGAAKGWQTRKANGWKPSAKGRELGDLYDRAKSGMADNRQAMVPFRTVDEAEARATLSATGLDVSGYEHALDNYAARHIFKSHGKARTELPRGQEPITRADIEHLPEIVSSPDRIEYAEKTKLGREAIRYTKKIGGTIIVVEEVRTKNKRLVPVSIKKFKNRATSDALTPLSTSGTLRSL